MAQVPNTKWYCDSVGWTAVTAWNQPQTPAAGTLQRQAAAPSVGNERVFVCIVSGAVGAAEPAWLVTKGAKTTDNAATWMECTGQPGVNGDTTNTPTWLQNKNQTVSLGLIIFDSVTSSLQIVTTSGATGNGAQPGFSATAGTTTVDNAATWTSLGLASAFGGWAAPHARIGNSLASTWAAAGDDIYTASEHAETQASGITLSVAGTVTSPNRVISVNKLAVPPTGANFASGASVTLTAGASFNCGGSVEFYGVTITSNNTMSLAQNGGEIETYSGCALVAPGAITCSNSALSKTIFSGGTTVQFTNVAGQLVVSNGAFEWGNGSLVGTAPTSLLSVSLGSNNVAILLHGLDLSAAGAGKTLFAILGGAANWILANSKINAAVTLSNGFSTSTRASVTLINVDSGATGFRNEWHTYAGDVTTETTITLKNGASDGVQSVSEKIVTSTLANPSVPMIWPPAEKRFGVWNTTTGKSVTATVQIISSGTLNNNDVWLEIEFLGSSASPVSSFANNGLANPLSTVAAQPASTATWNSQPATPVTQQLQVSFIPQMVGYVYGRIMVGKASATVWVDPELTVK